MEKPNVKVMYCPEHGLQFFDTKTETSEGKYPCEHAPHKENNMETIDQIHQKLETMDLTPFEKRDLKPLVEQAFRAGFTRALEKADPLTGYSNLTAAIEAGEPIDWERLDGLKVQCVKPEVGTLHGTLERNESLPADYSAGWWREGADGLYRSAFIYGWTEHDGWALWIEGEIPLVRKTADQLEVGTYFRSKFEGGREHLVYVGLRIGSNEKIIYYAPEMKKSYSPPYKWVVLEEYGTFQKPEGK